MCVLMKSHNTEAENYEYTKVTLSGILPQVIIGLIIRICAIYFGLVLDAGYLGQLRYTDIDYSVFLESSKYYIMFHYLFW